MYLPVNREKSKRIALVLIVAGLALAPDFMVPTPGLDLLLNTPLAMVISDIWEMEYWQGMLTTWIISYALIAAGLLVYPYNTKRLLVGRLKAGAKFMVTNPFIVVAAVVILYITYLIGNAFFESHYMILKEQAVSLMESVVR